MIKAIYFRNFKGFERAEMPIESLTTLIGTNASGKSNAIEGMKILSEAMTGRELSVILDGSKNMESNIRGGSKGCCRFTSSSFALGCLIGCGKVDLKYEIEITVSDRVMVSAESLYLVDDLKEESQFLFKTKRPNRESGDIKVTWNNGVRGRNPDILCIRLSSAISQMSSKIPQDTEQGERIVQYIRFIIDEFRNILFLDPEPVSMRGYARVNDTELKVNASNLSAVLYKLCKDKEKKAALLEAIRQLPENEISDISFAEGPLNDVILFLNEVHGKQIIKIDSARLSDGTLRCLAVLSALLSEKERGMIVIEEVDNGIHAGRAKKMIETISNIARERNLDVLITTHNAVMLNALSKDDLMGVDVVYRDINSGASAFIPLVKIDRMTELLANGRLGDVVTSGLILDYIKSPVVKADYSWLGV